MNRRALLVALSLAVACKNGGGASAKNSSGTIDPGETVAEVDGKKVTYGDVLSDKELGPKLRQAEVKALSELYDERRSFIDELVSRRLVEEQAKAKGETLDDYLQHDYAKSVPESTDAEAKAFYDENKAQMPGGQSFDDLKPRIKQVIKQNKLRDGMAKMLGDLRKQHNVQILIAAPDLPRIDVEAKGPMRGPETAKITIVEFSDFQCPYCGREYPVIEQLMKEYDGKVKLYFRNFPLSFHPYAEKAAEAGACAADQGKFWQMHDQMFSHQEKLTVEDLKGYAKTVGLDSSKFDVCLDSGQKKPQVDEDAKAGNAVGVNGTPAFFIDGIFINGAQPIEQFKTTIDRELMSKG